MYKTSTISRLYMILLIIPNMYPTQRTNINITLLPAVVRDFNDLKISSGHEAPKQISIAASKILIFSPYSRVTALRLMIESLWFQPTTLGLDHPKLRVMVS